MFCQVKEFLESVDKVFDNQQNLETTSRCWNQIKAPNSTYKLNFGVKLEIKCLLLQDSDAFTRAS